MRRILKQEEPSAQQPPKSAKRQAPPGIPTVGGGDEYVHERLLVSIADNDEAGRSPPAKRVQPPLVISQEAGSAPRTRAVVFGGRPTQLWNTNAAGAEECGDHLVSLKGSVGMDQSESGDEFDDDF